MEAKRTLFRRLLMLACTGAILLAISPNSRARFQGGGTLTVTVSPAPTTICTGQSQTWTATYSGGSCTGAPSYQWLVDNITVSGATSSTYTTSFPSYGTHSIYCTVRIQQGMTDCTGTGLASVTVTMCSNGGCISNLNVTANPNPACVNQSVQFHANPTDSCPKGALTYSWTFGDGATG